MSWLNQIDQSISPNDDFYNYINKKWLDENPIPSDMNRWGQFNIIDEKNRERVHELLKEDSEDKIFKNAQILFNSFFHKSGKNKLNELILDVMNIKNITELRKMWFYLITHQLISSPVSYYVYADMNNSERNIMYASTGGLGLPDRDYYFLDTMKEKREKYKEFMKSFYPLELNYDEIYNLENELAKWTFTKVEKRDPENYNNPTTSEEFKKKYPNLICQELFDLVEVEGSTMNISNPKFLKNFNDLFIDLNLNMLKEYFSWRLILSNAALVDSKYENKKFDFYGRYLSGTPEMKPTWKRAIDFTNSQLGEVIGIEFCKKYFPESSKNKCMEMVNYIKEELKERLLNNDWMTDDTKKKAVIKLEKMDVKIGYPNKEGLRDYSELRLNNSKTLFENNMTMNFFDVLENLGEVYKNKNKHRFHMYPHMVNAYYSPLNNEIVFPAGILQFPFFDENSEMIENFGGIGSVIGHEITHGFDDKGRQFDSDGNLNDWWDDQDAVKYKSKTDLIKELYASFTIDGKNLNGELTLGENIADLGGVSISLNALKKYLKNNPSEDIVKEGFTPTQRFFLSFGRIWRNKVRLEEAVKRLITDPHSPPQYRVNGVLMNLPDFYKAFSIKNGDGLYQEEDKIGSVW